jgi:hypothetical protein
MRVKVRILGGVWGTVAVVAVVAAISAGPSFGFRTGVGCHGAFQMPGYSIHSPVFDAVQVLSRKGMTCSKALHIAARARWLKGIQWRSGPQYGAGGHGGPFHVGPWHCFVLHRGSDFIDGRCSLGGRKVHFYDHRSYWQFPDPGFSPPTRRP